jgi:hypothetical protein
MLEKHYPTITSSLVPNTVPSTVPTNSNNATLAQWNIPTLSPQLSNVESNDNSTFRETAFIGSGFVAGTIILAVLAFWGHKFQKNKKNKKVLELASAFSGGNCSLSCSTHSLSDDSNDDVEVQLERAYEFSQSPFNFSRDDLMA